MPLQKELKGAKVTRQAILRHLRRLRKRGQTIVEISDLVEWVMGLSCRYRRAKGGLKPRGSK